jgi:hypothetical protein
VVAGLLVAQRSAAARALVQITGELEGANPKAMANPTRAAQDRQQSFAGRQSVISRLTVVALNELVATTKPPTGAITAPVMNGPINFAGLPQNQLFSRLLTGNRASTDTKPYQYESWTDEACIENGWCELIGRE